jgi:hypothetical protein
VANLIRIGLRFQGHIDVSIIQSVQEHWHVRATCQCSWERARALVLSCRSRTMADATVQMLGLSGDAVAVPVTAEPGIDLTKVLEAQVFKDWLVNINADPKLFIEKVHVQSLDMFGPRVGFIKFISTAKVHVGGEKGVINVPGIVFMRGGAVSAHSRRTLPPHSTSPPSPSSHLPAFGPSDAPWLRRPVSQPRSRCS